MTLFQSIVLGIVQGLGEFLPISSSAHLILVPWVLGWPDHGLTFDVALHLGTLIALLIYFHRDWWALGKAVLRARPNNLQKQMAGDNELRMAVFIVLATLPGAVLGLLLEKHVETTFRNPSLIAVTLSAMGVILWLVDKKAPKNRDITGVTLYDALIIGVSQGLALVPGISRSGITITTGLLRGLDRQGAARFSFLLSMPIIAGACVLKLRHLTPEDFTLTFMVGVLMAGISGYLAIGGLIRFLQTRSYGVFAVYRVAIGLFVGLLVFLRHQ